MDEVLPIIDHTPTLDSSISDHNDCSINLEMNNDGTKNNAEVLDVNNEAMIPIKVEDDKSTVALVDCVREQKESIISLDDNNVIVNENEEVANEIKIEDETSTEQIENETERGNSSAANKCTQTENPKNFKIVFNVFRGPEKTPETVGSMSLKREYEDITNEDPRREGIKNIMKVIEEGINNYILKEEPDVVEVPLIPEVHEIIDDEEEEIPIEMEVGQEIADRDIEVPNSTEEIRNLDVDSSEVSSPVEVEQPQNVNEEVQASPVNVTEVTESMENGNEVQEQPTLENDNDTPQSNDTSQNSKKLSNESYKICSVCSKKFRRARYYDRHVNLCQKKSTNTNNVGSSSNDSVTSEEVESSKRPRGRKRGWRKNTNTDKGSKRGKTKNVDDSINSENGASNDESTDGGNLEIENCTNNENTDNLIDEPVEGCLKDMRNLCIKSSTFDIRQHDEHAITADGRSKFPFVGFEKASKKSSKMNANNSSRNKSSTINTDNSITKITDFIGNSLVPGKIAFVTDNMNDDIFFEPPLDRLDDIGEKASDRSFGDSVKMSKNKLKVCGICKEKFINELQFKFHEGKCHERKVHADQFGNILMDFT